MKLTVVQTLPALAAGGVERGTVEVATELVRRGHRAIVVSGGGPMVAELEAAGAEHVTLAIGRKTPASLLLVPGLRQVLLSSRAHILHSRSRLPAWISWMAWNSIRKPDRPRFVTSVHGPYSVNAYSRIMLRGERVIAISRFIHDYIRDNYVTDMGRVRVIPRGISRERFPYGYRPGAAWVDRWRAEFPGAGQRFTIALPARLTRWKGQQDFIEVIGRLKQAGVPVHGFIVGGADRRRLRYEQELKRQVVDASLTDTISFTGHRDDLREIMSVTDLVMSLAREPEAFGRTALEALGLGVPVVAYDHGGASEVLQGIYPRGLVEPGNTAAAADRARDFYAAMPPVPDSNPFTLEAMLDSTIALYTELAAGGSNGG